MLSLYVIVFAKFAMLVLLCVIGHVHGYEQKQHIHHFQTVLPCNISLSDISIRARSNSVMHATAKMWTTTHHIVDWHETATRQFNSSLDYMYTKKYNIDSDKMTYTSYNYSTYIHFPDILKSLIKLDVLISIKKNVYIDKHSIHTIMHISDIPVIGTGTLYTRTNFMNTKNIRSLSIFTYPVLPWYLQFLHSVVESEVDKSTDRYHTVFMANICK